MCTAELFFFFDWLSTYWYLVSSMGQAHTSCALVSSVLVAQCCCGGIFIATLKYPLRQQYLQNTMAADSKPRFKHEVSERKFASEKV